MYDLPLIQKDIIEQHIKKHTKNHPDLPIEFGVAIYTDGGGHLGNAHMGIPNLGGYGVHGFVYANTPTTTGAGITGYTVSDLGYIVNQRLNQTSELVDIYTQKLTKETPTQVTPLFYLFAYGSLLDATNNVAESTGLKTALDIVERIHAELPLTRVNVRIDSKYVLNNMLHRQRYVNNGWITSQGQPLANKELWVEITARLEELSVLGIRWTAEWVKGHSDFFGNILADREASKALVAATNNFFTEQFTISPAQGYWTSANKGSIATVPAHYFLTDTTWFHNTLTGHIERDDGLHVMFTGTFKEDETIGQPNSNTGCGVVLIKEKPEHLTALEQIAKNLDRVDNGLETYGVFTGNLNVLMNPDFVRDINGRPEQFLIMNRNRKQFLAVDKKEVLARVHPPELAFEQMDKFDKIYATLERVVSGELFKHECLTDITDLIYEVTKGPKKTTTKLLLGNDPAFKVPVNVIVYDSNHVYKTIVSNCILTHGITTPRRRVFSGLKDHNVRVYVLTAFDAFIGFRYYTVIHLDSDEWGIWTNPAANLRTL